MAESKNASAQGDSDAVDGGGTGRDTTDLLPTATTTTTPVFYPYLRILRRLQARSSSARGASAAPSLPSFVREWGGEGGGRGRRLRGGSRR